MKLIDKYLMINSITYLPLRFPSSVITFANKFQFAEKKRKQAYINIREITIDNK